MFLLSFTILTKEWRHINNYDAVHIKLKNVLSKNFIPVSGSLLGYRALTAKLRLKYNILLPMNLVNDIIYHIDPQRMLDRRPCKPKPPKKTFVSKGVNWVYSMDGHDKLMGKLFIYSCFSCFMSQFYLPLTLCN